MVKRFKNWWVNFLADPHRDRIQQNALDALRAAGETDEIIILECTKVPPYSMKKLPRSGPAWFIQTSTARSFRVMVWVEVDDATEKVTRTLVCS